MKSRNSHFGNLWTIRILLIMQSCKEKEKETTFFAFPEKEQFISNATDTITLEENLTLMGNIKQCLSLSDTSFLITDGQHVIVYGADGRQQTVISERGHARNEYVDVGVIYVSPHYIYLWCDMTLKLLPMTHNYAS